MQDVPKRPLISVVMATYNGSRFLAEQMDSILAQTYRPIELVVVDDNSTDNTRAVLDSYASKFPEIRIEQNQETLGYIKNFEKGMLLAKGDLIALSDQDDRWHPEKLSLLYEALGNRELIYSNSELIDENGLSLGKKMSDIRNQISYTDCLMYAIGAWAPGHAMLFKKSVFERCRPFPDLVTHDFWLGFVAACKGPVLYFPGSLVYYRQHAQNAIGANTHAKKAEQKKPSVEWRKQRSRARMQLLFEKCPAENTEQKQVLEILSRTYQHSGLQNNWVRMVTFLRYRNRILAYKKKSSFGKILFCFKMFFKIDY